MAATVTPTLILTNIGLWLCFMASPNEEKERFRFRFTFRVRVERKLLMK